MLCNPNLYVIAGAPGAGKTTVLRELQKRGFCYVPEVARQIIQEQVASGGAALPWADRETFTQLMLQRSIEYYAQHTPAADVMFADRGIPDTIYYARLIGLAHSEEIWTACKHYRYAPLIFLAPAWEEIYHTDGERKQDFAEAQRTYELMAETYRDCDYETVELPKLSLPQRVEFIVRRIS